MGSPRRGRLKLIRLQMIWPWGVLAAATQAARAAPPRRSSPQPHGGPAPAALGVAAPAVLAAAAIRGCGRAMEGARARARRG